VAAGIRRIEAVTAAAAENFVATEMALLKEVQAVLKNTKNPVAGIRQLQDENSKLQKEIEKLRAEKAGGLKDELLASAALHGEIQLIAQRVALDNGSIKNLIFELRGQQDNLVVVLVTTDGGKVTLHIGISDALVGTKKIHAGEMVKDLAAFIQGGGGGQHFYATAGGKNPDGIDAALNRAKELMQTL
jgi:alanyl-tRNA synthetase